MTNTEYFINDDDEPQWNYCLYCGEAVEAPAKYCCEEHEEHRLLEHPKL